MIRSRLISGLICGLLPLLAAFSAQAATIRVMGGEVLVPVSDAQDSHGGSSLAPLRLDAPEASSAEFDVLAYNRLSDPRKLLMELDNAPWIADGAPSDRHIYISFAPWSADSRELFFKLRQRPEHIQIRWLPASGGRKSAFNIVRELSVTRDFQRLEQLFEQGYLHSPDSSLNSFAVRVGVYADDLRRALEQYTQRQRRGGLGFPTLIIPASYGVEIFSGVPESLEELYGQVAQRGEAIEPLSQAAHFLRRDYEIEPVRKTMTYVNTAPDNQDVFVRPFFGAARYEALVPNHRVVITGRVKGTDWLEFRPLLSDRTPGYIHAPGMGYIVSQNYREVPVRRGSYVATEETTLYAAPFIESRHVARIMPGERYTVAGMAEYANRWWYAILFYSDGRRAYAPAEHMQPVDGRR